MTVAEEKKQLRQRLLAERKAIPAAEKAALDAALVKAIAESEAFLEADLILGFLPIRGEPDLTPLLQAALSAGKAVALPRCEADGMRFLRFDANTVCVPDRFGILTPPPEAPVAVSTARTLCLLPGLAATESGFRLGYGGGFYDRFLPIFPGHTLFALYHRFLLPTLPLEPSDAPVETILTEKGVILPT